MGRKPAEFVQHPLPFPNPSVYRGVVRHVVDGDTYDVAIDVGFNVYLYETVRLRGVDTPELFGAERPAGLAAKQFAALLLLNQPVELVVHADPQSFGRYIADVRVRDGEDWVDVATLLRQAGHA